MNWVSVKERLPETNMDVLVWDGQFIVGWYSGSRWRSASHIFHVQSLVTHWADIEPPKEGE